MCVRQRVTTIYRDGQTDVEYEIHHCTNSVNGQQCSNTTEWEPIRRHVPDNCRRTVAQPSGQSQQQVVLHQNVSPRRPEPEERRYESNIIIGFRGLRSPTYNLRRIREGGRSHHGDTFVREVLPPAPEPPQIRSPGPSGGPLPAPTHFPRPSGRSPPPPTSPTIPVPPNCPMPPHGGSDTGAVVIPNHLTSLQGGSSGVVSSAYATRDVAPPSLSAVPVVASSSRGSSASPLSRSRSHRSTPRTRLSLASWNDSAYGSGNISPVEPPKSESNVETRSTTTSRPSLNDSSNYANEPRHIHFENDRQPSSRASDRSYRAVNRVLGRPDETQRRMNDAMREAEGYQNRTSGHTERPVGSQQRRHERRHRHRDGSSRSSDK